MTLVERYKEILRTGRMNRKTFFSVLVLIVISTFLAINLDLYPYRQILGVITYSFLFGFLFLSLLGTEKINTTKRIVYSIGLSISFLMFFGYLINQTYYFFGYRIPLSTISLSLSLSLVLLIMIAMLYFKEKNNDQCSPSLELNLIPIEKVLISLSVFLPALSIYGIWVMNTTSNNLYILILYFLIVFLVILIASLNKRIPEKIYPFLIYFIGLSLVLPFALRSNYIMGDDVHYSFYLFKNIFIRLHWSILEDTPLSACLSITLLPTIYKSLLNINNQYIFKLLYPLLFSFAPLIIYELTRKYVKANYAFLASFFFMSQQAFLWTLYQARTDTAIFFFALSILVIFDGRMGSAKRKMLFLIFMFSVIVSHYSTTYIYFFTLVTVVIFSYLLSIKLRSQQKSLNKNISVSTSILFFTALFFWFSQVTKSGFGHGVRFVSKTIGELNQMFMMESRSEMVGTVFGQGIIERGAPYVIEFIFTWVVLVTIAIGIFYLIIKFRTVTLKSKEKVWFFLENRMDTECFALIMSCAGLLLVFVVLPFVSEGYGMIRTYCQSSIVLSVVFIIGAMVISERIKLRPVLLILIIILPYFLCVTGVTYQFFGYPRQPVLNYEGDIYHTYYIHDTEYRSGQWYMLYSKKNFEIYTDTAGDRVTSIIGSRIRSGPVNGTEEYIPYLKNIKPFPNKGFEDLKGYVYLRHVNVVGKMFAAKKLKYEDFSGNYTMLQISSNKIYANGGSEVYFTQRF